MTIRYLVDISDHGPRPAPAGMPRQHIVRNLSLPAAWKVVERHARRGVKLNGGAVVRNNWGMRGGVFPVSYRSAVIKVDVGAKRGWGRA